MPTSGSKLEVSPPRLSGFTASIGLTPSSGGASTRTMAAGAEVLQSKELSSILFFLISKNKMALMDLKERLN
jgi:hypothetical protein